MTTKEIRARVRVDTDEAKRKLDQFGKSSSNLAQTFAGLGGATIALQGLTQALRVGAREIKKFLDAGAEYTRVIHGHTVSVNQADAATRGLIDTVELHRGAAVLETAQLRLNETQMRAVAVAAVDLAQRTGGDATQAYRELTNALLTGREQGLKRYGVELEGIRGRTERVQSAVRQLTDRFAEQTTEIRDTKDAAYALQNAWGTMMAELARTVEQNNGPILSFFRSLTGVINDAANALNTMNNANENMARFTHQTRINEIMSDLEMLGYTAQGTRRRDVGGALLRLISPDDERRARALVEELDNLQARQVDLFSRGEGVRPRATTETEEPTPPGMPSSGGVSRINEALRMQEELVRMLAEAEAEELEIVRERKEVGDQLALIAEEQAYTQREKQIETEQMELERLERMQDLAREYHEERLEWEEAEAKKKQQTMNAAVSSIQTVGSVFGSVSQIMEKSMQAQGKSAEETAKAVETVKKIEGGFLVAYNVVMGATEIAKAAGSYPDIAGIIAHGAAAVAHFAAAGVAAAELGVSSSSSGAAAGAGAGSFHRSAPEAAMGAPGEGGKEQKSVINYYSLGNSGAGLGKELQKASWIADRTSSGAVLPAGVRYA